MRLRVSEFLRGRGRNREAAETLSYVLSEAMIRKDEPAIQSFEWEISWLQDEMIGCAPQSWSLSNCC